jgi:hypothetical protein
MTQQDVGLDPSACAELGLERGQVVGMVLIGGQTAITRRSKEK